MKKVCSRKLQKLAELVVEQDKLTKKVQNLEIDILHLASSGMKKC